MVGGGAAAAFSESSILLLRKLLQEMRQKQRERERERGVKRSFICVFREIDGDAAPISQAGITVYLISIRVWLGIKYHFG